MSFRKLLKPEKGPGCYDLHLYCDHENDEHEWDEFPHDFMAPDGRSAYRQARGEAGRSIVIARQRAQSAWLG